MAGVNDWDCTVRSGTRPVVLLHGSWSNSAKTWSTLAGDLRSQGRCVYAPNYGGDGGRSLAGRIPGVYATAPIPQSSREVGRFVDRVRTATGAATVDVVGHSQGGVVGLYYLKHGGSWKVHDLVAIASAFRGVTLRGLSDLVRGLQGAGVDPLPGASTVLGRVAGDRLAGSPLLRKLNASIAYPRGRITTISSRADALNHDVTRTQLPRSPYVDNLVVQDRCAGEQSAHSELPHSPVVGDMVSAALAARAPDSVECKPVRR
ncbi:esterase/lipase family protein [Gordonia zhaorongruii]|uniref:esterase/lipase family protein n=1 Tax=Gordonia zhaorongruii TaxID=2597659 RepID=UPI00399F1DEC